MTDNQTYPMIGLMSGTSGDGLDIAYCEFTYQNKWLFTIPACQTVEFPRDLHHDLMHSHTLGAEALRILDIRFGEWMGKEVKTFCRRRNLQPLAIASHGHTVFHRPAQKNTLQIGNGWSLMEGSGLPVINDFRMRDVQLGGQGAPLVPIGDMHLFGDYDACLNLGGIANISFQGNGSRKAFDVSPFNLLLNHYAKKAGQPYDDRGKLARSGTPNRDLLEALDAIPFYHKNSAKSLGREDLEETFFPLLAKYDGKEENILATLVEHYVNQLQKSLEKVRPKNLLVTGGGAYNSYFIEKLQAVLGNTEVVVPLEDVLEYKEALIFAFMGMLYLKGEVNCLSSVTGASKDSIGGVLYGSEVFPKRNPLSDLRTESYH
jgi:anhydro-N-acetylmuramic acid kinase